MLMYERKIPKTLDCGISVIMEVIGGKWKTCLIYNISNGLRRPGALQKHNPSASRRVLNQQLKELEEHRIVRRVIYAELPPRVEYFLTEFGESLLPVVHLMEKWGDENKELVMDLLAVSND